MLYDPKWEKQPETKADPFIMESLIAWLEKQPSRKSYPYTIACGCMLTQYFAAAGFKNPQVCYTWFKENGHKDSSATELKFPVIFDKIAGEAPHTFGAALSRARAHMRSL